MDNEAIKFQIQELIQKGYIQPISSPYKILIMLVHKKDGTRWLYIDYGYLKKS
jgi:hypothetical protein